MSPATSASSNAFELSSRELNGILRRGDQYLTTNAFEPSSRELNGIFRCGEQYMSSPCVLSSRELNCIL